ncbi:acetate--CoA ligase family protein [Achromobacter piechaudii]|uniref:Trans-feruloyl-CoA synthase FCS1 n=1 Tax=Achromobacter piechaudii TaxID=72556 RepID=A0ABN7F590_9BURK|nr:acetate--CoA ligase family protein [Achromobacter piechaudii]CAB3731264.1 Trans-feruloyl-CoA synthase FCS1 [Achromobacter piechaudii]CAB3909002.1 Trans-feruloyl-CoA synthase FCS1 [Achromobacter piechaudii]CAB3954612.1 Trans-feruloyl-CoA synthase FCS1 [Achromobacter piechaudii]
MSASSSSSSFAEALLSPRAVALVGASGDARKNTARPLRFMRKHGYSGALYPINPARAEILGERAYPSLLDLPGPVDHVFVMIPGSEVEAVLPACAEAGAKVVTVYSDGFGETGPEGQARQAALVAQARGLGLRLLGPNSIGLADLHTGGILSVNAAFEADTLISGDISMVSQSGSMMGSLLSRAAARGFGFAKSVSVGNESDISVGEVVDALVDDPHTKVILLFLETLRDAPTLARALSRARVQGKPVVAYKLGRSEQGDALAQSHTGAMAGNDAAVDAFLTAHGVMRVRHLETLFEIAPLASRYCRPLRVGAAEPDGAVARVAVITTTGGGAATVVDNLGLHGLAAVAPPTDFVRMIAQSGLVIRETPVIDLTLAASSAQYKLLLEHLLRADWCDAVLSVVGSSAQFHPDLAVKPLLEADKPQGKPLAVFLAPESPESLALLRAGGIAAFRTPEACADALSVFFAGAGQPPETGASVAWPAGLPQHGMLSEYESGTLFRSLGVPVAAGQLLAPDALHHTVPYPLVAKVCSPDLAHKTELGAVRVGVADEQALKIASLQMLEAVRRHAPTARIDGILVQPMESRLIELILGYRHDPLVGATVLLGAGGITAELSPDFALRLAPVSVEQAHEMILEVRQTRLIRGFRGLPEGDCDGLARAIAAFSTLACLESVRVEEAEINPLFVRADGVVAVDGLVRLA